VCVCVCACARVRRPWHYSNTFTSGRVITHAYTDLLWSTPVSVVSAISLSFSLLLQQSKPVWYLLLKLVRRELVRRWISVGATCGQDQSSCKALTQPQNSEPQNGRCTILSSRSALPNLFLFVSLNSSISYVSDLLGN
jgi:hypothetical protein